MIDRDLEVLTKDGKFEINLKSSLFKDISKTYWQGNCPDKKNNIVTICSGVIIRDNKILIIDEKKYNMFNLPGGKFEPHDRYINNTLFREVREEVGYNVLNCDIINTLHVYKDRYPFSIKLHLYLVKDYEDIIDLPETESKLKNLLPYKRLWTTLKFPKGYNRGTDNLEKWIEKEPSTTYKMAYNYFMGDYYRIGHFVDVYGNVELVKFNYKLNNIVSVQILNDNDKNMVYTYYNNKNNGGLEPFYIDMAEYSQVFKNVPIFDPEPID